MKKVIFAALLTALLPILTFCGTSGGQTEGIECSSEIRADDPLTIRFASPFVEKSNAELAAIAKSAVSISPSSMR